MKYFLLTTLVTIVLFVNISIGYGQCSSCSVTVNVSGTSSTGITATASNQTLCITGSGTYNGIINLNYQNNVTVCVGNNITVSSSASVSNTPLTARFNNYGTWNNSMNFGSGLYQSGVIYNNYGTVNTDQIQLNSNTINNYGSFNVSGSVIVNSGSNINTFAGSTMYLGGNLDVNSGGIVTLAGVMGVNGSVTNNNIIRGGGGPCGGLDVTGTFTNNGSGRIQNNGGLTINKVPSPNSGTVEPTVGVSNINPNITTQPSNVSSCPGGNASFSVTTTPAANTYQWQVQTGGTGPFTSLSGQTGSTLNLSGVTAGMSGNVYRVLVYSCPNFVISNTATLTVNPNVSGTIASINVNCNGALTGSITISPSGGSGSYQYSVNGGSTWQSSATFSGLGAGTYNVRIRDAANTSCAATLNAAYTITQPALLTATVSKTNVLCNGASTGSITITSPAGGVSPYQYSINGGSYQSSGSFTGLASGSYTLNIRDANNCVVALPGQTITQPALLSATVSKTDVLCNGASTG
ncbi:SprB repeat-containing protein, partial [Sporocytophaga myxococcoides]|uniref:SprB repeat-containing protein n=1 Tax=Sporocytophaga myxococcoides TaxID=153721 RepID=UPI0005EE49B0